jgi:hypothetical protein
MQNHRHEIYILLYDGKNLKVFTVVKISKDNDYYISMFPIPGTDYHFSRHASGVRHTRSRTDNIDQKSTTFCSIDNLQNFEQITCLAFSPTSYLDYFSDHKWKPIDGTIILDLRHYPPEATLNLHIYAINKKSIQKFFDLYHDSDQIHIFKRCDPYLGIVVQQIKTETGFYSNPGKGSRT